MSSYSYFRQAAAALVVVLVAMLVSFGDSKCAFEAIFNFGDSNTDTGGFFAAFPALSPPYGITYFKRPSGRASDGRLIIDFLAQALGLPFLSPYLQSVGSDYKHGVNFATQASTALLPNTSQFVTGVSPFSLAIQLSQMKQFKSQVDAHSSSKEQSNLPWSDIFGKSLYTIYIGQNDFTGNLGNGIGGVQQIEPQVVNQIASTIKEIYGLGGRTFLVLNLAPIGCYPAFLVKLPHGDSDLDGSGCMKSYNDAVVDYNKKLKDAVFGVKKDYTDANVIYVDIYSMLLELFRNPTGHGLKYGVSTCCGVGGASYNYNPDVTCGNSKEINGKTVTANACQDPYNYVSWDGIHMTEAANKIITNAIVSGYYVDPPFDLHKVCDIQPIG